MKRARDIWKDICTEENVREAYRCAVRGRSMLRRVIRFREDEEGNLARVRQILIDRSYAVSDYRFFDKMEGPKLRHISALPFFPDRIIHWAVMRQVQPIFERTFISQTYATIPGRGHHDALRQLKTYLQDPRAKYCLKMDFHHFFESIDKDLLFKKVKEHIKDPDVLEFFSEVIFSYPKSGVPLGNLTSQYLANLYLSDMDHYMKEQYHALFYLRYMDDIVVLGWNKAWLRRVKNVVERMGAELGLTLNDNWQIFPVDDRGVDFAGYRTFPEYCLLRKRIKRNLKSKLKDLDDRMDRPSYELTPSDVGVWASYKGILDHCDGHRLATKTVYRIGTKMDVLLCKR